jgi:hypothetical protein
MSTYLERVRNRIDPVEPTKATITIVPGGTPINVQFNPTSLTLKRDVTWVEGSTHEQTWGGGLAFDRGNTDDLDFSLLLDESEYRPSGLAAAAGTFAASSVIAGLGASGAGGLASALLGSAFYNDKTVKDQIDFLYALTLPYVTQADDGVRLGGKRPPLVRFEWGTGFTFLGVFKSLNVEITLWEFDGAPKRATAKVTMIGRYVAIPADDEVPADFFAPYNPTSAKTASIEALITKMTSGLP